VFLIGHHQSFDERIKRLCTSPTHRVQQLADPPLGCLLQLHSYTVDRLTVALGVRFAKYDFGSVLKKKPAVFSSVLNFSN